MIKLIVGIKGSGKRKHLIELVNDSAKNTNGNIVCVEKGNKLTFDLQHSVRLVDVNNYGVAGYDAFYGFLAGLLAGNYDITEIYVDSVIKIGDADLDRLAAFTEKVDALTAESGVKVVLMVTAAEADLPESMKKYL